MYVHAIACSCAVDYKWIELVRSTLLFLASCHSAIRDPIALRFRTSTLLSREKRVTLT